MSLQNKITIGIRDSNLSKAQTKEFILLAEKKIEEINKDSFALKLIKTSGDIHNNQRLDRIGGKGLFIKEIEERILSNDVDIGVHSIKDMPAICNEDLEIFCYMSRLDNSDVLISNSGKGLAKLDSGSIVGTSSIRRRAQILNFRKDLNIKLLRGNVDTRITKLRNKEYDAIILAHAGLKRLDIESEITEILSHQYFLPAAGQGAVGIQSKINSKFRKIFKSINDEKTELTIAAERSFLQTIMANCNSPVSVYAKIEDQKLILQCQILSHSGELIFDESMSSEPEEGQSIGRELGINAIQTLGQDTIDKLDNLENDFNYTP
mgnify:CR=1 FL=1|tara:strand:- start:3788 stop:4750 length:963 start_codon:yes stop_codon:yes gene_type:complete